MSHLQPSGDPEAISSPQEILKPSPALHLQEHFTSGLAWTMFDESISGMVKDSHKESDTPMDSAPDQQGPFGLRRNRPTAPRYFRLWKKGGRLFSAIIALNIFLLGCALITSGSLKQVDIHEPQVLVFLCILMVLSILWMFFQIYITHKHPNAILFKDCHAGPVWLRGGLLLFAVCTLLLDILKIGYYQGYISCVSPMKVFYPVMQMVFVIIQSYFLWVSSKHCIQIHLNVTRCGLMLLLTTNLAVWMAAVTDESSHETIQWVEHLNDNDTEKENLIHVKEDIEREGSCECNSVCDILKTAYYYLYPFNIEYSLFASAMAYVMWKNVGRSIDDHARHHNPPKLHSYRQIPFVGLSCGISMVVVGLALFVMYKIQYKDEAQREHALTMFFIFHIVCLNLMSLVSLGGFIVHRFDRRKMDNHKNPSRSMDVGLLLVATLGQYCISYYSIVAMVASNPRDLLRVLTLTYSLLLIVEHSLQNVFIIEGLHRQVPDEDQPKYKAAPQLPSNHPLDLHNASEDPVPESVISTTSKRLNPSRRFASVRAVYTSALSTHKKRRRLLREIYLFLLLANILFWILSAFGARLRFDNHLEVNFYGFPMWVMITNICLPFGIFYHMHAAASLLELCFFP